MQSWRLALVMDVELAQTCIGIVNRISHRTCCTCVQQQRGIKQRTYHHVHKSGHRSPGVYVRYTGCTLPA